MKSVPRRPATILAAALLLLLGGGCTIVRSVTRRAPFPGGDSADVVQALERDLSLSVEAVAPSRALLRIGGPDRSDTLHCRRDDLTASVHVTGGPDEIVIRVSWCNRRPTAEEVRAGTEFVEELCGQIATECPAVGPWAADDSL